MTRRVAVVGAGITGLACAWRLAADHPGCDVVVVEASPQVGGRIDAGTFDGVVVDSGADAFLARVPEAVALCGELGLDTELVHPATGSALVWAAGRLRRLPDGLVLGVPTDLDALAASGIVSAAGVRRAGADPGPPGPVVDPEGGGDTSVGSFIRHRLGDEVAELLVAPLLGGVNAGDADQLSLTAGAPQLAEAAGSPDLLAALRQRAAPAPGTPVFAGFTTGTTTLTNAIVRALPPGTVHTGQPVERLARSAGGFTLTVGGSGSLTADAVVLALPSWAAAPLVADLDPGLEGVAHELDTLEWASVAMTTLAVDATRVAHPLDASGYLVPAGGRRTLTAASFASTKWAHLHRPGRAVLRVSAGHAGDDSPLHLTDDELVAALTVDLGEHIGLDGPPERARITRWERALPQYRPGHLGRSRSWQRQVWDAHPGLWLTGASFAGLGIPACVRQGAEAAARVAGVTARGGS